jgi:predicted secreted protein
MTVVVDSYNTGSRDANIGNELNPSGVHCAPRTPHLQRSVILHTTKTYSMLVCVGTV